MPATSPICRCGQVGEWLVNGCVVVQVPYRPLVSLLLALRPEVLAGEYVDLWQVVKCASRLPLMWVDLTGVQCAPWERMEQMSVRELRKEVFACVKSPLATWREVAGKVLWGQLPAFLKVCRLRCSCDLWKPVVPLQCKDERFVKMVGVRVHRLVAKWLDVTTPESLLQVNALGAVEARLMLDDEIGPLMATIAFLRSLAPRNAEVREPLVPLGLWDLE